MEKQLNHSDHGSPAATKPLCYLAHSLHTPQNIGSLFRLADALGVEKIYLSGSSPMPTNPRVKRTARATEKYVEHSQEDNPITTLQALKSAGYIIVSLELTSDSIEVCDASVKSGDKVCLIIGAEHEGVAAELLAVSDFTVHIPMLGVNSSMNVATACAIASYELLKKMSQ